MRTSKKDIALCLCRGLFHKRLYTSKLECPHVELWSRFFVKYRCRALCLKSRCSASIMPCITGVSTIGNTTWYDKSHATWCFVIDECDEQSACIPFWIQIYFHIFPNRNHCSRSGSTTFSSSRTGITDNQEKAWFQTITTFFLDSLKNLNSQKFGNLFFRLLKFGKIR